MGERGGGGRFGELTEQERLVAEAVASGLRTKDVAAELHVSPRTVETHLGRVYRKLGVNSRSQLVALSQPGHREPDWSDMPETRYARTRGVSIAYQVIGDGPRDIVLVPGLASHIEMLWEQPQWRRFVRRISKLGRFIVFDKRGTGLSDPMLPGTAPTLEQRMDDVTSVMDAASSRKAVVIGISEGGPLSLYFAAAHPDRVAGVLLYGTTLPCAPADRWSDEMMEMVAEAHGTGAIAGSLWPSMARTEEGLRWLGRFERYAASPAMVRAIYETAFVLDPTWVLPAVRVPITVVHGREDPAVPFEQGEQIMQYLPGARFVPIDVVDHVPWGEVDLEAILFELGKLVGGGHWSDDTTTVLVAALVVAGVAPLSRGDVEHWISTMGGTVTRGDGGTVVAAFTGPSTAVRCAAMLQGLDRRLSTGVAVGEARISDGRIEGAVVEEAVRLAGSAEGGAVVSSSVRHVAQGAVEFAERPDGSFQAVAVAGR